MIQVLPTLSHSRHLTPFLAGYIAGQHVGDLVTQLFLLVILGLTAILEAGASFFSFLTPTSATFLYAFLLAIQPKTVLLTTAVLLGGILLLWIVHPGEVEPGWALRVRRRH